MRTTSYYSVRNSKNPNQSLDFPILCKLFLNIYSELKRQGFLQEALGYECVDMGHVAGTLGTDVPAIVLRKLRKDNIWPVEECSFGYQEDDLFDAIEFVFDIISAPIEQTGDYHSWNQCGWHYSNFNKELGQQEFLLMVNELLKDYKNGYELTAYGEVRDLSEKILEPLLDALLPTEDERILQIVEHAKKKYRDRHSSSQDRRDVIRNLGDILESLRKKIRKFSSQDESDLFNILNNFGFRHNNSSQKTDYDSKIFDSWLFYHYLAAVHAYLRLLKREQESLTIDEKSEAISQA